MITKKQEKEGRCLNTMGEIEAYTGRHKSVIRRWIKDHNFPAIKVDGRWESHTDLIDGYRKQRIKDQCRGCITA